MLRSDALLQAGAAAAPAPGCYVHIFEAAVSGESEMRLQRLTIAILFALVPASSVSAQNIVAGRKAWLRFNCYGCHGDNGKGARAPRVVGQNATNIRNAMRGDKGASGMRSYLEVPGIRPTDFEDLAAYLRSIGTRQEPKWHDWWRR